MASAEKRGKGPKPWRVRYRLPDGSKDSESGFETKKQALDWGHDQESKIRHGAWIDPKAGDVILDDWTKSWNKNQEVSLNTQVTREYLIKRFISPKFGRRPLNSIKHEEINAWEKGLPAQDNISLRTAQDARSLLGTILGDAVSVKPPVLPFNPAVRTRNRGRKTGRRLAVSPSRTWATPLEALLIAERATLLAGRDDDFVMLIDIAYTGKRWGETIGLELEFLLENFLNVEWQLTETKGKFHRQPPKDDSYRSTSWQPFIPIDLPPFLSSLLTEQASRARRSPCSCARVHGGSGKYLYSAPGSAHYRRSSFARRIFRPACDGRYPPGMKGEASLPVVVDGRTWPGVPVGSWLPAGPGGLFGHVLTRTAGARAWTAGEGPAEHGPSLAIWLPVKSSLTPHDLRHSHKTWMIEDGVPEILSEIRLGHEIPGMRGVYSHVSEVMREQLKAALQRRWEASLRARAALCPFSPVPALNRLLAPYRTLRVASTAGSEESDAPNLPQASVLQPGSTPRASV